MIVSDKTKLAAEAGAKTPWNMYGTPEEVITDNGAAFTSFEFRSAARDMEAGCTLAPAGKPQLRARVERVFGSIHTRFLSSIDGPPFENVLARQIGRAHV